MASIGFSKPYKLQFIN